MNRVAGCLAVTFGLVLTCAQPVQAGGAWTPTPGHGYVYVGFITR